MANFFKSSFLRLFTTGFVAGMIGVVALQPAGATQAQRQGSHVASTR